MVELNIQSKKGNQGVKKKRETTSHRTHDYRDLCHHFPMLASPLVAQKGIVLEFTKPLNLTYKKIGAGGTPLCVNRRHCSRDGRHS
jgi:hypothetical protein